MVKVQTMTREKAQLHRFIHSNSDVREDSRILPSLVMHKVLMRALLVVRIYGLRVENLCFVEQVAVETEDFLILREGRCWCHFEQLHEMILWKMRIF